jgi:hypothetical protein
MILFSLMLAGPVTKEKKDLSSLLSHRRTLILPFLAVGLDEA